VFSPVFEEHPMTHRSATQLFRRARVARSLTAAGLLALAATPAAATTVTVTFSGVVSGVTDSTDQGALSGSNIVAGVSTFSGGFSFDSAAPPQFQSPGFGQYPGGTLTLVIDGVHVFSGANPSVAIWNDHSTFFDRFNVSPSNSSDSTFPFLFNQNDNLFRLTLQDSTSSVFSDASLPTSLDLADFDQRFDGFFVRTDLDRQNGKLWILSGEITSLSVSLPEPSASGLLVVPAALLVASLTGRRLRRGTA
jgi:hypothetical protein